MIKQIMKEHWKPYSLAIILVVLTGSMAFIIAPQAGLTGQVTNVSTQVYIYKAEPANCTIELKPGANFVSFFCIQENEALNETFVTANNTTINYEKIYQYNPETPNNAWSINNPGLPNYAVQDLTQLTRRKGYWIFMNKSENFSKEGLMYSRTEIDLKDGWNLIGYPSGFNKSVTDALSSISTKYSRLENYPYPDGAQTWLVHTPPDSGTLTEMKPTQAYWIKATQNIQWVVDW